MTIVIDTETTGFSPSADELLQVAIIDGEGNTLFNSYLRPEKVNSWPEAQRVNGITPEMVKDAPTIRDVLPEIQRIVSGANAIVGYNVGFDYSFLLCAGCEFRGVDTEPPACELVDVMEMFAPVYGEWNEYYGGFKWQKLTTAAAHFGYDWGEDNAHDALADCRATLFVWKKLHNKREV